MINPLIPSAFDVMAGCAFALCTILLVTLVGILLRVRVITDAALAVLRTPRRWLDRKRPGQ